ncbi:MAG TPA: DUF6519 domain-containing protein, partial [Opitutaceae bacterium]|nr:DUF6519 domain-containing protein [Opitutaceae bacterium]
MKGDFSRIRHNLNKHYTAVLQQQGRVALDADANEQQAIDQHIRDTEITDIIGPFGGPKGDAGFKITVPDANTILIGRGRYYVEGILCESHKILDYSNQPYLINPGATDAELLQQVTSGSAYALQLYLEVWQRLITVLDDPCLREPAIGQADTTARLQTVWRVVAEPVSNANANNQPGACCADMYKKVRTPGTGKLWARTNPGSGDCPCEPTPQAGYRGLENQLYRVEIHHGGDGKTATFKWSRENGSVVSAITEVSSNTLTVNSLGPDANLGYQANNWVELTDDSYLFGPTPNQPGSLIQVQNPVPNTLSLVLQQPAVGIDPSINARVRRWDQFGASAGADGVNLAADTWIDLENGIQVKFSAGQYNSGDYWLIPARTATGQIEWPPCGSDGNNYQPPLTTPIHRAPLACVHWDLQKQTFTVEDCRRSFPPLTQLGSDTCVTYYVGDGSNSVGDYTSINEAIKHLPPEGGEICVLAGQYFENVEIAGRVDVSIFGCGPDTRIISPSLQPATNVTVNHRPVITVLNSQHIRLESFVVEADTGCIGILLDQIAAYPYIAGTNTLAISRIKSKGTKDVEMRDLIVLSSNRPAIDVIQSSAVTIERSKIAMAEVNSNYPAIYVSGTEIKVQDNWVGTLSTAVLPSVVQGDLAPAKSASIGTHVVVPLNGFVQMDKALEIQYKLPSTEYLSIPSVNIITHLPSTGAKAMQPAGTGGIQVGGISTDIYILRNEIQGGRGNGITLGSLTGIDLKGNPVGGVIGVFPPDQPTGECCQQTLLFPSTYIYNSNGDKARIVVEGRIKNLHIENNRIRDMGLCGIGPVGFFDIRNQQEVVTVHGLFIVENEITACPNRPITTLTQEQSVFMGYGAISLPDVAGVVVRDNQITNTGETLKDPVCGIFVLHGEQVEISRNQILDLRDWSTANVQSLSGYRAGICLAMVTPPADTVGWVKYFENFSSYNPGFIESRTIYLGDVPALVVQENVVKVPLGLALAVNGLGAYSIQGNQFATGGTVKNEGTAMAASVLIFNFGTPVEKPRPVTRAAEIIGMLLAGKAEGLNWETAFADSTINSIVGAVAPGPVLFSQNRCSLELANTEAKAYTSVFI